MNELEQQMAEILDALGVDEKVKRRFLRAAHKYGEKQQNKIIQVLIAELENFIDHEKQRLHQIRKLGFEKRNILEDTEREVSLDQIDAKINNL